MDQKIVGSYDDPIFLQINFPRIADVSANDYTAASFKGGDGKTEQKPFVVCHPKSLKMKVRTWKEEDITWIFEAGKDPIPLKKIYASPVPLVVESGDVTETQVTSIQIGY